MNVLVSIICLIFFQSISYAAMVKPAHIDLGGLKELVEETKNFVNLPPHELEIALEKSAVRLQDLLLSSQFVLSDNHYRTMAQLGIQDTTRSYFPHARIEVQPNLYFLRALMKVHAEALKVLNEVASNIIDVEQYHDAKNALMAARKYQSCLQSIAIGLRRGSCSEIDGVALTKNLPLLTKFERSFMLAFRISRLAFTKYHEQHSVDDFQAITYLELNISDDSNAKNIMPFVVTRAEFSEMTFFKTSDLERAPECQTIRTTLKAIEAVVDSQTLCTPGTIFGINRCWMQNSSSNLRKIILPATDNFEFSNVLVSQELKFDVLAEMQRYDLRSACGYGKRY